ncbi:zinc finger protein 271-like isoform X2 [Leguminivora glycinivorella]|uniref:zinc finger protein 271-like isoform X2 n=1 Tax=Leguminivora glycinivorella TaxID=1035111 RepID=UPI00200F8F5E|nr:zinc finger protein 271-like isoform X2 [Leguminivora glycinivorella]
MLVTNPLTTNAVKAAWDSAADSQAGPRLPLSAGARELLTMAYNMNHESLSDIKDLHNNPDFCPNETPQEKNRTRNTNAERISPNQKLNKKKKQRFRENQFSDKNNLITHSLTHTVNEQKSAPNVDETYHSVFDKWEKEYTSKLNLKRKFLKCNTCLKRFAQKEALDNHLLFDCFEYFCDFCKRGFQTKHKLIHHMSLHMGIKTCEICQKDPRNMKKYFCGSCHKGFINKPMLSKHLLTHAKRKSYACEVCNKEFRYKTQFHIHLLTPGHFSRRHEEFKSKEHMNTHVSEKRFSEKLAVMNLLKQPSDVSIQYLSKKEYKCKEISDSRPKSQATQYFCHTCKIQFTEKEEFLNHKCKKEYYCNFCSMCFTQKTVLTNHIRTHTGDKPYSCDICHKRFGRTHVLKMHKLIHSGLKPHSCNICNKQFRLKTALKNHVQRLHTAIKPYACDVCFKRFTRSFELKYHYRTHTGEKPNICEICQMKFTQPNAVRRHIIRVHVGETYRIHKT